MGTADKCNENNNDCICERWAGTSFEHSTSAYVRFYVNGWEQIFNIYSGLKIFEWRISSARAKSYHKDKRKEI